MNRMLIRDAAVGAPLSAFALARAGLEAEQHAAVVGLAERVGGAGVGAGRVVAVATLMGRGEVAAEPFDLHPRPVRDVIGHGA